MPTTPHIPSTRPADQPNLPTNQPKPPFVPPSNPPKASFRVALSLGISALAAVFALNATGFAAENNLLTTNHGNNFAVNHNLADTNNNISHWGFLFHHVHNFDNHKESGNFSG